MSEIKHILLIPAEGDPHNLLREGPCGARPPMAWYCGDYQAWEQWHRGMDHSEPCARAAMVERARCALVLAWNWNPVAEVQPYIERAGIDYALLAPFVVYALKGMDVGQGPWPGTLVLLDAEGQEVSDE